jgi:hypothetical protein
MIFWNLQSIGSSQESEELLLVNESLSLKKNRSGLTSWHSKSRAGRTTQWHVTSAQRPKN